MIGSQEELDGELLEWLEQAYAFSERKGGAHETSPLDTANASFPGG